MGKPGDGSADIAVIGIAIGAGLAVVIVLGAVGVFYPPALSLLVCLIGHLGGSVGGSCI